MTEGLRGIFETILAMSITGSMIIGVVLILRALLRRIPKKYICLLWLAVCFRLICPFAAEGPLPDLWQAYGNQAGQGGMNLWENAGGQGMNLFQPGNQGGYRTGTGAWPAGGKDDGFPALASGYLYGEGGMTAAGTQNGNGTITENNPLQTGGENGQERKQSLTLADAFLSLTFAEKLFWAGCFVWLAGAAGLALYGILRYTVLLRRLKTAVRTKDGLFQTEHVQTPMVFGFLRPRIYLPRGFGEQVSGREYELILRHEQIHIRRRDYLFKTAVYAAWCLHWYNPLVWLAVFLMQKDMEMACDEAVVKEEKEDIRQVYAGALLHFSMGRSGLLSYVAFGESNTESRIKNILKYKKQPLLVSAGILAVILTVFICLVTRPHTVDGGPEQEGGKNSVTVNGEDQTGGPEEVEYLEDGTIVYGSMEQMQNIYRVRWEAALTEQGKLPKDSVVKYYNGYYSENTEEKPLDREAEFVFYALQEDYRIVIYKTSVVYRVKDSKIYVSSEEDKIYENVTTAEDAQKQGVISYYQYGMQEDGEFKQERFWQPLEEAALLSSSGYYRELLEPETAVSFLLRLEGGNGRKLGSTEGGVYVAYTFGDGSSATYLMQKQDSSFWFPERILSREETEYLSLVTAVLETVNPKELAKVTAEWDAADLRYLEPLAAAPKTEPEFVLLGRTEDQEAALYGLQGGLGMVLAAGGETYPLLMDWASPQMVIPRIYAGDYDGDKNREYALYTHMGTGTGYSVSQLYILEFSGREMEVREFSYENVCSQLERITAEWDKEYGTVDLMVDGERTGQALYLQQCLEDTGGEYQSIEWRNIIDFSERDGQWYLWAQGGLQLTDIWIEYSCSAEALAPVIYRADGTFTLGEITLKTNAYEPEKKEPEAVREFEEKIIHTAYADVTHDGIEDAVVTSLAREKEAGLEPDGMTPEEILSTNVTLCHIRVYDGTVLESARKGEGFDTSYAIWEKELAQPHAGNGMVFLTRQEGQDYLLESSAWFGQGAGEYRYQVFSLDKHKRLYNKDEGQVSFDTNGFAVQEDSEKAFSVPDMVEYTQKLSVWTDQAVLLARTDVDEEPRITTPEKEAAMEAWEIWKPLLSSQEISLTGSDDLEKALTQYREDIFQNLS